MIYRILKKIRDVIRRFSVYFQKKPFSKALMKLLIASILAFVVDLPFLEEFKTALEIINLLS